jgi:quaternary ammonium compound-resistance protein SugE
MSTTLAWGILIFAGVLESFWAIGLKLSDGLSKPLYTIATIICAALSFYLLALAMKVLPAGVAYSAWGAIGISGVVIIEYMFFNGEMSLIKSISILLIIIGIFGLNN